MPDRFEHKRTSRNATGIAMTGFAVLGLFVLAFGLDAHWVVIALFAALVAPAVWAIIADTNASLEISDSAMSWQVGARGEQVDLDDIDYVKARTALDFSQRATVYRKSGPRLHIPGPCIPSGRKLDGALEARGVSVQRLF